MKAWRDWRWHRVGEGADEYRVTRHHSKHRVHDVPTERYFKIVVPVVMKRAHVVRYAMCRRDWLKLRVGRFCRYEQYCRVQTMTLRPCLLHYHCHALHSSSPSPTVYLSHVASYS